MAIGEGASTSCQSLKGPIEDRVRPAGPALRLGRDPWNSLHRISATMNGDQRPQPPEGRGGGEARRPGVWRPAEGP